jgi:hypothetical protein
MNHENVEHLVLTHTIVFLDGFSESLKNIFHTLLTRSKTLGAITAQLTLRRAHGFWSAGTV